MSKKRNTKLALASLMAVSAITPVVASADTNGSVTTEAGTSRSTEAQVTKTIDFTVEEASGLVKDYVQGPGILQERNGQQYIYLDKLSEAVLNMVTAVTVDGESALNEYGGIHSSSDCTDSHKTNKNKLEVQEENNYVKKT